MKGYNTYFDRQTVPVDLHDRLLALENTTPQKNLFGGKYMKFGALAACAALLFGIGSGWLTGGQKLVDPILPAPDNTWVVYSSDCLSSAPPEEDPLSLDSAIDPYVFVAQGPEGEVKMPFPNVHTVDFADATNVLEIAAQIILPDGSFTVMLEKEDIQKLFWGAEGKPVVENPKLDTGDFPLMLMNWAGYTVRGQATYDGEGNLWELAVVGELGRNRFSLRAAPGRLPPTCVVEPGRNETEVNGVPVTAWYRSYDKDGDGEIDHICTSQFMAGEVGIRFENVNAPLKAGQDEATDLGGAILFNSMLVNQLLYTDVGLYLDEVATCPDIPAWRKERFETLDAARTEADFAPYLPQTAPQGYGEFDGYLSYQEGNYNWLFAHWYRGYDDVEVEVHLPEDPESYPSNKTAVDVNVPESYDWRLYDGSISDSVPKEYQMEFYKPTFRAEDMSLEVVKARGREKDTGGMAYRFYVRHDNGVVVGYDCSDVSDEYVWSLVEATLSLP